MSDTSPKSILLDSRVGWRASTTTLSPDTNGALRIDALPGRAELPPVALDLGCAGPFATDPRERGFYWAEDRSHRVHRATLPDLGSAEIIRGFGGAGSAVRRLSRVRGLVILADGAIALSDTANRRIQVFAPAAWALLCVIEQPGWTPWGMAADHCGNLYVANRAHGQVLKFYRDGTARGILIKDLNSPTALSRSKTGTLAILDGDSVVVLRQGKTIKLDGPPGCSAIAIDSQDSLYVGTQTGLLVRFNWDATEKSYRRAGETALERDGAITQMLWTSSLGLLLASYAPCDARAQLLRVRTDGASAPEGTLLTDALDGGLDGCPWDRIELDADIPAGCSIEVSTQTAKTDTWSEDKAPFEPAMPALPLTTGQTESLIQSAAAQFLRLRLRFRSNGIDSPLVRSIRLRFPRDSYLKYLPSIYQEDLESRFFLDRFLSIFQTTFDGYDRQIDNISDLFDPLATPEKMLPWLAAWLAFPLKPQWTIAEKRNALRQAWSLYVRRGTPDGLSSLVKLYTGVDASITEHFRLRPLLILGTLGQPKLGQRQVGQRKLGQTSRLWSRDFYARLQLDAYSRLGYFRLPNTPEPAVEPLAWGANRFSVFFVANPDTVDDTLKQVQQIVESEKPAPAQAIYCPIFARMRVGVQSTIGVDTRLGVITPMTLHRTATLGYDSILGCASQEQQFRKFGSALVPSAGVSTRLQ